MTSEYGGGSSNGMSCSSEDDKFSDAMAAFSSFDALDFSSRG